MSGEGIILSIILWIAGFIILGFVIRSSIDKSRTSRKLDELIVEMQMLRREIRENKHIIDKRM